MEEKNINHEEELGARSSGAEKDSSGNVKFVEQNAPIAEDNGNGVIAGQIKPLGGVSDYSYTLYSDLGANTADTVKAAPANVYTVKCYNTNAAARYFQIFNKASDPTDTSEVPVWEMLVPASAEAAAGSEDFGPGGLFLSTGLAWGFSTTSEVYNAGTATDQTTFINYK